MPRLFAGFRCVLPFVGMSRRVKSGGTVGVEGKTGAAPGQLAPFTVAPPRHNLNRSHLVLEQGTNDAAGSRHFHSHKRNATHTRGSSQPKVDSYSRYQSKINSARRRDPAATASPAAAHRRQPATPAPRLGSRKHKPVRPQVETKAFPVCLPLCLFSRIL